ncbi:MAG: DUF433 domain-containing protein [Bacteroidota bacterium]|nr:DUF433 domain-containing protein [Bacteroidota bacterium]
MLHKPGETNSTRVCIIVEGDLPLLKPEQMIYGEVSAREYPLYSRRDVSEALRMPYSTLYWWLRRNHRESLISVSPDDRALNFLQLSEAFAIAYMRRTLGISLPKIRQASEYLKNSLGIPYPLVNPGIRVGTDVYFKNARDILLNASSYGQVESEELIGQYIDRLKFGEEDHLPDVVHLWIPGRERKGVQIDPRIRFGQPTVAGTGISVAVVQDRYEAGESAEDIAASYEISYARVEDALAYAAR